MLSDNDIHHIVGLLYVSAGEVGNVTMLGEKVFDAASGTKRDVDIVIVKAGATSVVLPARPLGPEGLMGRDVSRSE